MFRLFLLFVLVPVAELALLLRVGQWLGLWPTIALIVGTALVGSRLAAGQGLAVWRAVERALADGRLPGPEIVDGLIILVSGALLLTPGLLTDVVGLLGLVPLTRPLFRELVMRRFRRSMKDGRVRISVFGRGQPTRSPAFSRDAGESRRPNTADAAGSTGSASVSGEAKRTPQFDRGS